MSYSRKLILHVHIFSGYCCILKQVTHFISFRFLNPFHFHCYSVSVYSVGCLSMSILCFFSCRRCRSIHTHSYNYVLNYFDLSLIIIITTIIIYRYFHFVLLKIKFTTYVYEMF